MKVVQTRTSKGLFKVIGGTGRSQAATMILEPGRSTGGTENRHVASDQWLYVVSGAGKAIVGRRTVPLRAGALLLIEAGEEHEIVNTGTEPLATVNIYSPPAY